MRGPVSNEWPKREGAYRIALVGESPGVAECRMGRPFTGVAGWMLDSPPAAVGIAREECLVANVSQWRPSATANDFHLLQWEGEEVQTGIAQLLADLHTFRPNVVVTLGNVPLHLFKHGNVPPERNGNGTFKWRSSVTKWRGSLFITHQTLVDGWNREHSARGEGQAQLLPVYPFKAIATWHPAYVNRVYSKRFDFLSDLRKARSEGVTPELNLPTVNITYGPRD